jgi:hypothetical protein
MKLSKYFGLLILTALLTSLTLLFWTCIPPCPHGIPPELGIGMSVGPETAKEGPHALSPRGVGIRSKVHEPRQPSINQ